MNQTSFESSDRINKVKRIKIFTVVQVNVIEAWDYPDNLDAMTQFGALRSI